MVYVTLGIFLFCIAAGWVGLLVWLMARQLLTPPRMNDGKALYILKRLSPEDIGLDFSDIVFDINDAHRPGDKLRICAWWIPARVPSDKTVIVIHGYSDAKVGGIAWAPTWHALGWHVLAIDLRAHGESSGQYCTAGFYERDDLDQIIDQVRISKPGATTHVALFGVSVGAAVALACAARRTDIAAVVVESIYADYRIAVRAHGRRLAMPVEFAYDWAYALAERISGARFDDVRPTSLIPHIHAPLLLISSGADTFVSRDEHDQLTAAMHGRINTKRTNTKRTKNERSLTDQSRTETSLTEQPLPQHSQHVIIDACQHTMGILKDPDAYRAIIGNFVKQNVVE